MTDIANNRSDDDTGQKVQPDQNQKTQTSNTQDAISEVYYGQSVPDRRQVNPLSKFASVNYQLSLYMLTPSAYNTFINSGRRDISAFNRAISIQNIIPGSSAARNEGVFLVAQTGGINNSVEQRVDGFELDFYIDNLIINTTQAMTGTQSTAGTYNLRMSIIEPYGFSLITNLKRADQQIKLASGQPGPNNPIKNLFVLGIKFLGYDINGKLLTGQEVFGGSVLDPLASGDSDGVFARYLDFTIYSFNFKLDGKAIRYDLEGAVISSDAYKTKRGFTDTQVTVQADTVFNALKGTNGLEIALNDHQQSLYDQGKIEHPTTYTFEFAPGAEEIAEAILVNSSEYNQYLFNINASGAKNTDQADERVGLYTQVTPTVKNWKFRTQTRITEILEVVIKYSSYMTAALKEIYDNQKQPDEFTGDWVILQSGQKANIAWFSVFAEFTNPRYDTIQQDWIFDIKYIIQKYETPYVLSPYANPGARYYGPHKKYSYWFTGENTEVIKYEQTFNNAYFLNVVAAPNNQNSNTTVKVGSSPPDGVRAGDITGRYSDAVNSYITTLFDPGSQVSASLEILGDPDYLGAPYSSSINKLFNKFYGADGFTISGSGGQVFIEIDFREAVDYDERSGLMMINDQISFYSNPWNKKEINNFIRGLVYQVSAVEHKFMRGKFTQQLTLIYCDPARLNLGDDFDFGRTTSQVADQTSGENGTTPTASGGTAGNTGQRRDEPTSTQNNTNTTINPSSPIAPSQVTRYNPITGGFIADEDNLPFAFTGTTYYDPNDYNLGGRGPGGG
jgi:hypothetical protein